MIRRRLCALAAVVAGASLLTGCRVDTAVSVVEHPGGGGSVAVTVAFDPAAVKALGGQTALARQLQYADLQSAGWAVSGPTLASDGAASVTATHGFSDQAQLSQLMSSIAGGGPPGAAPPFRLSVSEGGGFWTDRTVVRGAVDLRCGLACFGDSGLQTSLGGPVGVSPQPLEASAGESLAQVFHFTVGLRLPGHVQSSTGDPTVARDGTLTWAAPLGSDVALGAVTESVDWGHVIPVAVAAGLLVLGGGFGGWRLRRRRRRGGSAPGDVQLVPALVGEPVGSEPGADVTAWPTV